jgi:epoxyqueuosine reductase
MKLLLHACCAPCLLYPHAFLKEQGVDITVFFYNPNIHPFREFKKRFDTLRTYTKEHNLPLIAETEYGLTYFLRHVVFHEKERCTICYLMRLEKVVMQAKNLGFDAFSTTLLYSKYQQHDKITALASNLATTHHAEFLYHDFRVGWQLGVDKAVELNMYRQPYCGCIYSEQDRFDKKHPASSL